MSARPAHHRRRTAVAGGLAARMALWAGLLASVPAAATGQIRDVIAYQGQPRPLHGEPLAPLLDQPAYWQVLRDAAGTALGSCSANWRGYRAWWALRDGHLWLERMVYGACAGSRAPEADLQAYFPGRATPLVADWYSGTLVVPLGAPEGNAHMGYSTVYPRYALVEIDAGKVTASREVGHATLVRLQQAPGAQPGGAAPATDPQPH